MRSIVHTIACLFTFFRYLLLWDYNDYKHWDCLKMKEKMFQKKQFPTLQSLAIDVVAKNYYLYPQLQGISQRTRQIIIEKSIESCKGDQNNILISAPNITQEKYWKAKCEKQKDRFFPIKLEDHGLSWKVAYIEKYLQKFLQSLESYEAKKTELIEMIRVINPWIFNASIHINATDIKLDQICKYLTNLVNLRIKCSQGKNIEYKKKIVGMKFTEARDISEILRQTQSLISLNISGNLIDDDLFKFICPGLLLNTTIVELNLSYNNLADQGSRKLAKFLMKNKILTHLNLASNSIGYDGSRYISQAIKLNTTLDSLNLKLNSIDDKGGAKFFKDLIFNTNIKILDLQANLLGSTSARKISLYLQSPNPLKQLYVGSNNFNQEQLNIIADSIPQQISKDYFVKSQYMLIRLGQ